MFRTLVFGSYGEFHYAFGQTTKLSLLQHNKLKGLP